MILIIRLYACVKTPQLRTLANHSGVRWMSTTNSNTYLDASLLPGQETKQT